MGKVQLLGSLISFDDKDSVVDLNRTGQPAFLKPLQNG